MNLRTKMRVGDVVRWHIVRTVRQQTLAEHLYKVWLLTEELHRRIGLPPDTKGAALEWALTHDLPEVLLGDLPTPVKRAIEGRAKDSDFWRKLEREMLPEHKQRTIVGTPTAYVVKIADCIEGWHFLFNEGVNAHGADTMDRLRRRARGIADAAQKLWPEFHWVDATDAVIEELMSGEIEHCG